MPDNIQAMTQEEHLVEYLRRVHTASVRQIMLEAGIGSPTKAVSLARRNGYHIHKEYRSGLNRYGKRVRYMVYTLEAGK